MVQYSDCKYNLVMSVYSYVVVNSLKNIITIKKAALKQQVLSTKALVFVT
jgi:hypothetical protein